MDDEKPAERQPDIEASDKPASISEGVSNLVGSITTLVKDAASVVVDAAKGSPPVSNRVETAVPSVEENYDAGPMTADELAEHAAADTQPAAKAKRPKRKKTAAVKQPAKAPKKRTKAATRKTAAGKTKKASKKSAEKSAEKSTRKKMPKKAAKKSRPKASKLPTRKTAKKTAKKKKKSKK